MPLFPRPIGQKTTVLNNNTRTYLTALFLFLLCGFSSEAKSNLLYEFEVSVVDENDEPLIAVNVYTDDQKFTGFTDENGKITLKDLNYNDLVNFSYLGYKSLSLPFFKIRQLGGKIRMRPDTELLADVEVVVIGRRDEVEEDIPYEVKNITRKQIAFTNSQTSADILRDHAGIFVQKSQMGGGSPVIRGFEANRVLLVVDGVRMNNAIYRNGHLQNSITVDASILERAEVIFGPGSLVYGSDALGGVVHYRTRDPKLYYGSQKDGYVSETNIFTRYSSANTEKTLHADLSYGKKKWGSLTSISFTDYDDLRAGSKRPEGYEDFGKRFFFQFRDNDNNSDQSIENVTINDGLDTLANYDLQVGTAYWQADFLQKLKFQPNDNLYFTANLQYSTTSDVPRYDNLSDVSIDDELGLDFSRQRELKWSEWYYGPQKRFLSSLKTQIRNGSFFDKATIIAAFQNINEERIQRRFNRSNYDFGTETVNVYTLTADIDKKYGDRKQHEVSYGLDIAHNDVESIAGKINVRTGGRLLAGLSRYPLQGSTMTQGGAYAAYRWKTADSLLVFNAGLRYSYVRLSSVFSPNDPIDWPRDWTEGTGIINVNTDITYGIGATLNSPDKWQVRFLASKAFRSPNIDDFAKIREKNGFITIPNPELEPEKAYSGELTIAKELGDMNSRNGSAVKVSATAYYTFLQDAISRRNAPLPDPLDVIPPEREGFLYQIDTLANGEIRQDSFITQANVNAQNGFVYGFSVNLKARLGRSWEANAGINYTYGRLRYIQDYYSNEDVYLTSIDTLIPIDHIPPVYGQTGLKFKTDRFQAEFVVRYSFAKKVEDYAVNAINYDEGTRQFEVERDGSTDNIDEGPVRYFITENGNVGEEYLGTYGYTLFNLYTSWQFSKSFSLDVALENITDIHYRPFASGVSGPGRNLIIALRGKF